MNLDPRTLEAGVAGVTAGLLAARFLPTVVHGAISNYYQFRANWERGTMGILYDAQNRDRVSYRIAIDQASKEVNIFQTKANREAGSAEYPGFLSRVLCAVASSALLTTGAVILNGAINSGLIHR